MNAVLIGFSLFWTSRWLTSGRDRKVLHGGVILLGRIVEKASRQAASGLRRLKTSSASSALQNYRWNFKPDSSSFDDVFPVAHAPA